MLWQLLRPGSRQFCHKLDHLKMDFRNLDYPKLDFRNLDYPKLVFRNLDYPKMDFRNLDYPKLVFRNLDYPNLVFRHYHELDHPKMDFRNLDYPKLVHHEWGYLKAVSRCPRVCRRPRQLHRKKPCISRHWPRTMRRHQLHRLHLQRRQLQLRPGCSRRQRHRHLSGRTSR